MNDLAFEKCYEHLSKLCSFAYIPAMGKDFLIISFIDNNKDLVKLSHVCGRCQFSSSIILRKDIIREFYEEDSELHLRMLEEYMPPEIGTGSVYLFLPEFLSVLYEKVCPIIPLPSYCIIEPPSYL